MMFLWCLILICIGGVYGDSCFLKLRDCDDSFTISDYPKNVEGLENGCTALQSLAQCTMTELENCDEFENKEGKAENEIDKYILRHIVNFLEVSCDPESSIYKVTSENVECAYPILTNMELHCDLDDASEKRRNAAKSYEQVLRGTGRSEDFMECMYHIREVACKASLVSDSCGSEILLPLAKILSSLNYSIQRHCEKDIKDKIPSFVEAVAVGQHEAVAVTKRPNRLRLVKRIG